MDVLTQLNTKERDLRLAQEQLLQAETEAKAELEFQVRQRTRDLSRLLQDVESENRSLAELSVNDGLTKLRNRRYFDDIYAQSWQDAEEAGLPISLLLLDVDHFKQVNDQYGHLVGDECLVQVASALRHSVHHPEDVVCRYGGEEFVVILPDTCSDNAMLVAERVRRFIEGMDIALEQKVIRITVSVGVASLYPTSDDTPQDLLARCDEALYTAKREGRNRVRMAPGSGEGRIERPQEAG